MAERDGRSTFAKASADRWTAAPTTTAFVMRLLAVALIVAAVVTIYAHSTSAYFFNDDFHWLAQTQVFVPLNMLDLRRYEHFYRPVIELYFFAGLTLFGCTPFPFHVTSVALHLLTTVLVFQFARAVSAHVAFAFLSALFFAVQPGLVDAVTWIAAITDLLPVVWYVLAVWLHVRFLRERRAAAYLPTLGAFVLCHLTHESAATLLPMLLLTELAFAATGSLRQRLHSVARHWTSYLPFAIALAAFLLVAYVVNTRSYLVEEGHYRFGWHAAGNIVNYVIWLYVGQRAALDYLATLATIAAVLIWGTARMRFAIAWMVITLLPVAFFTWENAPRYLYLPAVGFAMLVADLLIALQRALARRTSPRAAQGVLIAAVALLAIRFAVFAKKAADSFPAQTAAYQRFVHQLRVANPDAANGETVIIDQRHLEGVPELYREPAARVGLCRPDVRLELR